MLYLFLFSLADAVIRGRMPTHIIKKYNIDYGFTQSDQLECGDIKGYISRCYTIDKNAPLIQASIEKIHKRVNENYEFYIKINSNYWYNNNIECIVKTISEYIDTNSYFNIIELNDNTYFILINKSFSIDELIYINNKTHTFVEFYNKSHTGIRWYQNIKYYSNPINHIECK